MSTQVVDKGTERQPAHGDRVGALSRRTRELADAAGVPFPELDARDQRPSALFVGEPGRGKTSLINALLGEAILPTGDGGLPCYIVLRHGTRSAFIHRLGQSQEVEPDPASLSAALQDLRGHENVWVEIHSDAAILDALDLIDTPANAAANVRDASATIRALGDADVLVFVADARSALTAPELSYLEEVSGASVATLLVLTRRDLFPAWQQIAADNRSLLDQYGSNPTSVRIRAVSALLAVEAARLAYEAPTARLLDERSGLGALREELAALATTEILALRLEREIRAADAVLARLMDNEASRVVAADEPRLSQALAEVEARIEAFQRTAGDHVPRVGDEFTRIELGLRRSLMLRLQELGRNWSSRIDAMSMNQLDRLPAELEGDIAKLFGHLQQELRVELAAAVSRLEGGLGIAGVMVAPDARLSVASGRRLIQLQDRPPELDRADQLLQAAGVLVGAGGPMVVANLISQVLGVALSAALAPYALAAGLALGGLRLFQQRRSKDLSVARRQAHEVVRDSVEHLRADVPPTLSLRLLDVRRVVESDVRQLIDRRAEELRGQRDDLRRRANEDDATRAQHHAETERRLRSLQGGRRTAAALLAELEVGRQRP